MHNNPVEGQSIVFASFAINSIVYIFAYRSMRLPLYRMNKLTANKPLIWAVAGGLSDHCDCLSDPRIARAAGDRTLNLQEWSLGDRDCPHPVDSWLRSARQSATGCIPMIEDITK